MGRRDHSRSSACNDSGEDERLGRKPERKEGRRDRRDKDEDSLPSSINEDDAKPKGLQKRKERDDDDDDDRRRKRKPRLSSDDESDSSSSVESRDHRHRSKDSKKKKKKKKETKKKRRKKDDKKSQKKRDRKDKKSSKKKRSRDDEALSRNYDLADALHQLLTDHPTKEMAVDTLPILLIKLGGGGQIDIGQMPNRDAAQGIQRVLQTLAFLGVSEEAPQVYRWAVPGGGKPNDERFLIRIVRTMLNDIGFTMEAIQQHHQPTQKPAPISSNRQQDESELTKIRDRALQMLHSFQDVSSSQPSTLPRELGGLCNMILNGDSIALDGLPDPQLRTALETLFQQCGLELCEIGDDSDYEQQQETQAAAHSHSNNKDTTPAMGYGLPEASVEQNDFVKAKLMSVMNACEAMASNPDAAMALVSTRTTHRKKGPLPMPAGFHAPEESSDEDGPAPVGDMARRKESAMSKELIKQHADIRSRQLRGAITGQAELMSTDPNQREEWMLVPGKFDFLSAIKAGNPMKTRNFQAKSKFGGGEPSMKESIDPKVKAEMDAIMQAHQDARGPTLVEQHRLKREQERNEKAASAGSQGEWNWNRDKDLDSGRRVDKSALAMVLGGATKDLKTKFQGGF